MIKSRLILLIVGLTLVLTACPGAPTPNTPPTASNQTVSTPVNTPVTITLQATDADGDTLTFSITEQPASGTLSGTAPNVTYTPNEDFEGSDSFKFKANDGKADSNIATVTINVTADSSQPPVADNKSVTVVQGTTATVTLMATDPQDEDVTFAIDTSALALGTATLDGETVTYTSNAGTGTDTFTYTATNESGATSAPATVTVTVVAPGTLTVADDSYKTIVNARLNAGVDRGGLIGAVTDGVLANDVGVTAITATTDPENGTLDFDLDAGNFRYTPNADFIGSDSFTYTATNGTDTATATVSITVAPANPEVPGSKLILPDTTDVLSTVVDDAAEGDVIYLRSGTYATPGVPLKDNQQLIGAGSALELDGVSLAPAATAPIVENATGYTFSLIALANNTTVKGLTVQNAALDGIRGSDKLTGAIVIEDVTVVDAQENGIRFTGVPAAVLRTDNDRGNYTVALRNVTITRPGRADLTFGGQGNGVSLNDASSMTLDNVTVEGLKADQTGMRVESEFTSTVTISNSVVRSDGTGVSGIWIFKNNSYSNNANESTVTATLNGNSIEFTAAPNTLTVGYRFTRQPLGASSFGDPPVPDPADNGPLNVSGTGNTVTGQESIIDISCAPTIAVTSTVSINGAPRGCP